MPGRAVARRIQPLLIDITQRNDLHIAPLLYSMQDIIKQIITSAAKANDGHIDSAIGPERT